MRTFSAVLLAGLTTVVVAVLALTAEVPLIHRVAALEGCAPSNQVCDGGQAAGFALGTGAAIVVGFMAGRQVFRWMRRAGVDASAA